MLTERVLGIALLQERGGKGPDWTSGLVGTQPICAQLIQRDAEKSMSRVRVWWVRRRTLQLDQMHAKMYLLQQSFVNTTRIPQ